MEKIRSRSNSSSEGKFFLINFEPKEGKARVLDEELYNFNKKPLVLVSWQLR